MNKFVEIVTDEEKIVFKIFGKNVIKKMHKNNGKFILKIKTQFVNILYALNKEKRRRLRTELYNEFSQNNYLKQIEYIEAKYSDYWIFMPMHCIGDLLMFCRNLKAFKKINGGKILLIVKDMQRKEFVERFSSVDKAVIMDKQYYFYGLYEQNIVYNTQIIKGKVHIINADSITNTLGIKFTTPKALYSFSLNLPETNQDLENPIVCNQDITEVEKICHDFNVNKKTIFLAPYAESLNYKVLSNDFWVNLADSFIKNGYNIIFNAPSETFPHYTCLFLPIVQVGLLAQKCYGGITFRSGLSDIILLSGADNFYTIYPELMVHPTLGISQRNIWKKTYIFDKNLSDEENMYRIFSFESIIGISSKNEIVFNCSEEEFSKILINKMLNNEESLDNITI